MGVIILDPFLSGEVELRNYLVISHANDLFQKLQLLEFEDLHRNRSSLWFGCMDYSYSQVNIKARGPLRSNKLLSRLGMRLSRDLGCDFNSCLVNLYKNGRDSCGWHADDEGIFGENPTIASISLGCARQFQLRPIPGTRFGNTCHTFFDLTLRHGDLLVMRGDVQKYWHHCVPPEVSDCTPRINLTFRHVIDSFRN
jgi:alkylated DNA repair dioxygenase AlkB